MTRCAFTKIKYYFELALIADLRFAEEIFGSFNQSYETVGAEREKSVQGAKTYAGVIANAVVIATSKQMGHARIQSFAKGGPTMTPFFLRRDDPSTTIRGLSSTRQRNDI